MSDSTPPLIITPDFPPAAGGIQLLMHRVAAGLRDFDPLVLTLSSPGHIAFDRDAEIRIERIHRNAGVPHRLAIARLNARALRRAAQSAPRFVIAGHVTAAPAGAAIRCARRSKLLIYLHADEIRHRPGLTRLGLRWADAVIAVSRHTKKMALDLGAREERVHVVHPGVDAPAPFERRPSGRPTIVTVARLYDAYKGHDMMLRAMPLIRAHVPDVQWIVVGDGPLRPWLEALAEAHGVSDSVRFVGSVADRERDAWLGRAHVFAMPSRLPASGIGGEGFGISFLEASARELPVVAAASGGALDAVAPDVSGLLVDPESHTELATTILSLLENPRRANDLGEAGARRAAQFTWDRHVEQLRALIAAL